MNTSSKQFYKELKTQISQMVYINNTGSFSVFSVLDGIFDFHSTLCANKHGSKVA